MSDGMTGYDPAFPVTLSNSVHATGMELRDYFAAQALAGILHNKPFDDMSIAEMIRWAALVAKLSYAVAEAMCDERIAMGVK
jgi:hypothetical protein